MSALSQLLDNSGELGERLAHRLSILEQRLHDVVRIDDAVVDAATSHLSDAGGKRLRPLLCFLTAELGDTPQAPEVFDSALAVELTHLASLYHDDVIDDAPLRRGVPSAQHLYGNAAAIMAGDVLFARASSIVAGLGPEAVHLHATAFERLCIGELHETAGPGVGADPIVYYIHVLADKTGSLIAAAARYGVLAAGGKSELAEAVANYGEKVGVAFQLADDVIDLVSDEAVTGKTPGTDLLEGVDTMPTLLLRDRRARGELSVHSDKAGAEILELLDGGHLDEANNLGRAVALLRNHPVVEETRQLAYQWAEAARAELAAVPAGEVRTALEQFAQAMVDRMS
ncbi:MAG: polyprenyl synthetase family protein [Actinomycetaceae bacterium]|nr:polyprenyl synthetase family protein [Arcanobacterium sp.]MDD7686965.1 polyprenyl synthetase family protein [Actinomycetaceae bacterium]MDY5273380.1 polyprenyl synthetase family protein [Arcanobacterium sp.]